MAYNFFPGQYQPNFYGQNQVPLPYQQQKVEVVRVNGRNGAEAYNLLPNSSALLLDESGTIVWLVTSDGAGYKTVSPYDITPHKSAPDPDYLTLEQRISKLEEAVNGISANTSAVKSKRDKSTADAD